METEKKKGRRLNKYVENYVIFDLETTGISTRDDAIIEISAIKVIGHEPGEEFSALVNPLRHIPEEASRVNGITDEMVRDALPLKEVLPAFLSFIGEEILVGHNIHTFDMIFLRQAAKELLHKELENDYIDTLSMARACLPELSRHRLVDVASYFSIATAGAHRAFNDCVMNQKCYEELGKLLKEDSVEFCPKCGGELRRRSGKFGQFYGCSNYPQCRFTRNA